MFQSELLQMTDLVTGRRAAVRMEPGESALPFREMLDRYVKRPDLDRLLAQGRITAGFAESLRAIQDYVYACSEDGRLLDIYPGLRFGQGERTLKLDDVPAGARFTSDGKAALLIEVEIDRMNVGYDRNWRGFHRRRWEQRADEYTAFVRECLEARYGPREADSVLQLDSPSQEMRLVEAVARRIWESDFESYSRFTGPKLAYKTGDETIRNIMQGAGGICSEKVQALKFVTDHYGIESEYIIAGPDAPGPVPEARLREMLTTFDFAFSKRHMRYWQHAALLYQVDGDTALVDATNGNIPFLFERNDAAERLLAYDDKPAVRVKMAVRPEDFYYHRVSQDIPEDLYFAMEGWIPDIDLVQVFDNELGLYISSDFMAAPVVFRSERAFERRRREYTAAAGSAGLRCSVGAEWSFESELGQRFAAANERAAAMIIAAKERLLDRYEECHGPGYEAGLVVIELAD